jgi:hypothetical protein
MNVDANPQRLAETEEFGGVVRALAEGRIAPARLAESAQAIRERLVKGAPASPGPGAGPSPILAKVGLVVLAGASAVLAVRHFAAVRPVTSQRAPALKVPTPAPETIPTTDPERPLEVPMAAPSPERTAPERPRAHPARGSRSAGEGASESAPARPPSTAASPSPQPEVPRAQQPVPAASPNRSDLSLALALFEQAKARASERQYGQALSKLEELRARFPGSPLTAEVELSRADYLARDGRLREAASLVETLAASPTHAGRRAELRRMLADLWIKQGQCAQAARALDQAIRAGLAPAEADVVRLGLEKCAPR